MFEFIKNLFTPKPIYIKYYICRNVGDNIIGWFDVNTKDMKNLLIIIKQEMEHRTNQTANIIHQIDGWGRDLYKVTLKPSGCSYIVSNSIR